MACESIFIEYFTTLAWFGVVIFGFLSVQSIYQAIYLETKAGKLEQEFAKLQHYKLVPRPLLPRVIAFVVCLGWIITVY